MKKALTSKTNSNEESIVIRNKNNEAEVLLKGTDVVFKVNKKEVNRLSQVQDAVDHAANTSNPHNVTKAQVGLSNVDNTSDLSKPISNATQLALDSLSNVDDSLQEQIYNIGNGSPKGTYATLVDLQTAYPTGTTGIYVVAADGHWYFWNGSAWADGGPYLTGVDIQQGYGTSTTSAISQAKLTSDSKIYTPATIYGSRVTSIAEDGVIKNLDRLTELYMNQLNLLPYTHFMWDGNAGYKVVDGKLVKAYDMSPNANDGITSAGTEPYAGGLIAPNENLKIKNNGVASSKKISIPNITRAIGVDFTIDIEFTPNKLKDGNNYYIGFSSDGSAFLGFQNWGGVTFAGEWYSFVSAGCNLESLIGKKQKLQFIKKGFNNEIWLNGKPLTILANEDRAIWINQIDLNGFDGTINHIQILNKALSAYEIQLTNELSKIQHPEIEGIDIGNQHWATSNYEGVVTGNGTVIPEYQYNAANSPEIVPLASSTFETDGTAWWENFLVTKSYDAANQCMLATSENDVFAQVYKTSNIIQNFQANKIYHYKFDVKSNDYNGVLNIGYSRTLINTISNPAITNVYQTIEYLGTWGALFASWTNGTTLSIDNVSIKEVGWDELTTPGWCYYNNDPALGAVYGKLYNWYAVAEIAKNPPMGWRVPSYADFFQLSDYSGGQSIAGIKLKIIYGNNLSGTNETGFSMLGTTSRSSNGEFTTDDANYNKLWLSTDSGLTTANHSVTYSYWSELYIDPSLDKRAGCALRLLRNEPVGDNEIMISTGRFATDISGSQKFIPIPFGYEVETVVINSSNNLTGVSAWIVDSGWSWSDQIFSNKSVDANITKQLRISTDNRVLQQDGFVIVLATGNTGDGMTIDVVLKKIQ